MATNSNYSYTVVLNFGVATWGVEVAVTTSGISNYNPLPSTGFNYYIETSPTIISNSITYKLIIPNDLSWSSIYLTYLASSRPDISVGNFEVPVSVWAPATSNVYNINNNIPRTLPKNNYYVTAFISGFSTLNTAFDITINNMAYDGNRKIVTVSFYCHSSPAVLSITISYIVYPASNSNFSFYYNTIPLGNTGSYRMIGPNSFSANKSIAYSEWVVGDRYIACN
jgi:hypothetical protein